MKITEEHEGARITHEFEEMTPEKRPQDPYGDGTGLTFETLEHGGEYPDSMPQAIRLTDAEGRSCIYVPIAVDGRVVDSKSFTLEPGPGPLRRNADSSRHPRDTPWLWFDLSRPRRLIGEFALVFFQDGPNVIRYSHWDISARKYLTGLISIHDDPPRD
jgi:hypothetical protein